MGRLRDELTSRNALPAWLSVALGLALVPASLWMLAVGEKGVWMLLAPIAILALLGDGIRDWHRTGSWTRRRVRSETEIAEEDASRNSWEGLELWLLVAVSVFMLCAAPLILLSGDTSTARFVGVVGAACLAVALYVRRRRHRVGGS